uniref:Pre-mRNA-splicing factor 18 n=1 Tax=Heterorhabditis bacteriophora TaxID=37862 RepID=A0A1I7WEZ9_HETBA
MRAEMERKRKHIAEIEIKGDGTKYFKRCDLAAKQEQDYINKLKQKQGLKEVRDDAVSFVSKRNSSTSESGSSNNMAQQQRAAASRVVDDKLPLQEVRRRLRERGQPIILFAETENDIRARLLKLEIEQPDMKEGWKNEMQTAMRDVDNELVKVIEGSLNNSAKHDVDLPSSFHDNWEKIEEQATLLGVGNDPHRDCDIILSMFQYLLARWGKVLNKRDDETKKSAAGKLEASIHKQTVMNLKPLLNSLENHSCNNDIRHHLTKICRLLILDRNYILANNAYMEMAIGNSPWPVGVTRSDLMYMKNECFNCITVLFLDYMHMSGEMDLDVSMKEVDSVEEVDMDMDNLDEKIEATREEIVQNPYNISLHEKLISLLRRNGDLQELNEARNQMAKLFPLSSKMWIEWIQDERSAETDASNIEKLFERAVFDSNSLDTWVEYVQWACGVDVLTARTVFESAITAIGLRVDIGGMLWESFLDFEEAILAGLNGADEEKQRTVVISLYKRALRVPHVDLLETWERYLAFAEGNVDEEIQAVYESSATAMKELAQHEMKLAETEDSLDTFYEYLQFEIGENVSNFLCPIISLEYISFIIGKGDPCRIQSFYERILDKYAQDEGVWLGYGKWCENSLKIHTSLSEWFVGEWDSHGEYRRNWAWFAFTKLGDVVKIGRKIWEDILASGGGRLAERWLEAIRLERQFGDVQIARKLLYKALNSVSDHPNIIFEYIIQFEREEGTLEQLDKALEKVNAQAIHRANRPQKQKDDAGKSKLQREEQKSKQTERVMDRKRHGLESSNAPVAKKTPTPPTQNLLNQPLVSSPSKDKDGFAMPMLPVKRKVLNFVKTFDLTYSSAPTSPLSDLSIEPGQSKEENSESRKFTVFVSNLDFKVTSDKIKQVLDGVVDVRLIYRGMSKLHKGYGYVDFDNEDDMRNALAKDRVPIDGRPMLISENNPEKRVGFKYKTGLEKTKIFVRNVHYDCSEDQLNKYSVNSDLLKTCASLHRKLSVALSNPPKKSDPPTIISDDFITDGRKGRSSMLQLVPRVVKKSPGMSNGSAASKSVPTSMSNDQFRQFLNNK